MSLAQDKSIQSASNWYFRFGAYAFFAILSAFITPQVIKALMERKPWFFSVLLTLLCCSVIFFRPPQGL